MSYFSKNIRFLRKKMGINQDSFDTIGIKKGTYSNYENGKTEPNIDTLVQISNFLGIDLNSLISIDLSQQDCEIANKVNSSDKNTHPNTYLNTHLLNEKRDLGDENTYLSSQLDDTHPYPSIAAESAEDTCKKSSPTQQYSGANDIIMGLVEQIKEQSEEIGALRQENSSLKHRLAQLAEDAGDVNSVPA